MEVLVKKDGDLCIGSADYSRTSVSSRVDTYHQWMISEFRISYLFTLRIEVVNIEVKN
jgi:hypothetical protein